MTRCMFVHKSLIKIFCIFSQRQGRHSLRVIALGANSGRTRPVLFKMLMSVLLSVGRQITKLFLCPCSRSV